MTARVAAALSALLVLAAASCRGSEPAPAGEGAGSGEDRPTVEGEAPTPERLAGIWWIESPRGIPSHWGNTVLRFSPDGTMAGTSTRVPLDSPESVSTYQIEGRTVSTGRGFIWEVGILEDGLLRSVLVRDYTHHVTSGAEWTWVRVSPNSLHSRGISAETPPDAGALPVSTTELAGVWLLEGTDHLLILSEQGGYATGPQVDTDPDDEGNFELDRDEGTVTLLSGEDSSTCDQKDRWVWEDLRLIFGAGILRAGVVDDECDRGLGEELTWIRLSP